MNVEGIVKQHLIGNGFDGLCNDECGCAVDDLGGMCPMGITFMCVPGYRWKCDDCGQVCEHWQKGGWCIRKDKQEIER